MNGDDRTAMIKILNAIDYGKLSYKETIRRVEALVQTEVTKQDSESDIKLISACEDLLEELNLCESKTLESHMTTNRTQVMLKIKRALFRRNAWKATIRITAATAAVFVTLLIADVVFQRGWFLKYSTEDEQQYVVQGQSFDPNLIGEGSATNTTVSSDLTTDCYEKLASFLGYEPVFPTQLPERLSVNGYHANRFIDEEICTVYYADATSNEITQFTQVRYTHIEDAYIAFEQNAEGELLMIGSVPIYRSMNMDRTYYSWSIDSNIFSLSGMLSDEDAIKMIQSTLEGKRNVQKNE